MGGQRRQGQARLSDKEQKRIDEAVLLCPGSPRRGASHWPFTIFLKSSTDFHDLAQQRRRPILDDEALKKLQNDGRFSKVTRYLNFTNADKTSNHIERDCHFRKR